MVPPVISNNATFDARDAPYCPATPGKHVVAAMRDPIAKLSRVLFYVAMFFVPLTAVRGVSGWPISDVALAFSAIVAAACLVRDRPTKIPRAILVGSVLAGLATLVLSLHSDDPAAEFLVGFRLVFVWLIWSFAATRSLYSLDHYKQAASAYVLGACLSSAVAIGQFIGIDTRPVFFADISTATARFIGLNGHPNGQGGALAVAASICMVAALYGLRRKFALAALALTLIGIVLTGSITAMIACGIAFALLVIRARRLRIIATGALLAIIVALGYQIFTAAFPTIVTPLDRISSATGETGVSTVDQRLQTVEFAIAQISLHPFSGVGFADGGGTYNGVTATHNMLVLSYYQGGPLLFAAVACVATAAVIAAWRSPRSPIAEALAIATFASLFFAQTGPSLYDRYAWLPVVLLLCSRPLWRCGRAPSISISQVQS